MDGMGEAPRGITRVVRGVKTSDGAGVALTRLIGTEDLPAIDPFLMLDEFGSEDPDAYIAGFPEHPHRGFETVTYMLEGHMRHRDNQGNQGDLGPGSVQWMTAGRGIVHSEMPQQADGAMRGFQLWVNLPAARKMTEPRYQDIAAERIPVVERPGLRVKIIAGSFDGVTGPVSAVATEPLYLDLALDAGAKVAVAVPRGHAGFAYAYEGAGRIAGTTLAKGTLGVLGAGGDVVIEASEATRLILVAGRPIEEPVARYGPFVMTTADEIRQAIRDYQAGRF